MTILIPLYRPLGDVTYSFLAPHYLVFTHKSSTSSISLTRYTGLKIHFKREKGLFTLSILCSGAHTYNRLVKDISRCVYSIKKEKSFLLFLNGLGYKISVDKNVLSSHLNYTKPVILTFPKESTLKEYLHKILLVKTSSPCHVGNIVSKFASFRKPDPYKGKGIYRLNESYFSIEK